MAGWYYRRQGERFGPVSLDELRQLVKSERLDASDSVSQDGATGWRAAGEIDGLFMPPAFPPSFRGDKTPVLGRSQFPDEPPPFPVRVAHTSSVASGQSFTKSSSNDGHWYHTSDERGERQGPVSLEQLQQLAASGRLHKDDAVWQPGTLVAVAASQVPGLFELARSASAVNARQHLPAGDPATTDAEHGRGNWALALGIIGMFAWLIPLFGFPVTIIGLVLGVKAQGTRTQMTGVVGATLCGIALLATSINSIVGAFHGAGDWTTLLSDNGTITFAENVDRQTLKTTNEGTCFSPGWVHVLIRAKRPFGDVRLIAHARIHGTEAWTTVFECTVDPGWDVCTKPILLDAVGIYDIKVINGKGETVAEGTVQVVSPIGE